MKKIYLACLIILLITLLSVSIFISINNSNEYENSLEQTYDKRITRPIRDLGEVKGITTNIWLHEESRLKRIVENEINYLFVDVGDINKQGELITSEQELKSFIDFIENYEEENKVEFVLIPYTEVILNKYDFSSFVFRQNLINNYKYLLELGFEGVLIDIEAIPLNLRQTYLDFLEKLDYEINKDNLIIVYAGPIDENPNVWEWESDFYIEVSNRVDIISVPSYDFNFNSAKKYENYLTEQIRLLNEENLNSNLVYTVPTHKSYPETTENSLKTFQKEISKHPNTKFIGITIFAEWTTSDEEWEIIENYNFL